MTNETLEQENAWLRKEMEELKHENAHLKRDFNGDLTSYAELYTHWRTQTSRADNAEASEAKLLEALTLMYSRWEDGITCYEARDGEIEIHQSSYPIGNILKLSGEEEDQILAAIHSAESRNK